MNKHSRGSFGRNELFGAMDTFAVPLAMQVRRRFAITLNLKGEKRQFIHGAEDSVVFLPPWNKRTAFAVMVVLLRINSIKVIAEEEETIDMLLDICAHKKDKKDLESWIKEVTIPL
jgi:hypothetical protein